MVTHAESLPGDGNNTSTNLGSTTVHMLAGIELTPRGIDGMAEYGHHPRIRGLRYPAFADHFGHIGVNSCIRLGKALEKYNLAWLEDMIPWQYPELLKEIKQQVNIPLNTGEEIYLKENFIRLASMHATDILHPDLATSGGILETKKIGDAIQEYGVPMAMHFAGSPVLVHGQRALRGGHRELPRNGKPLGRCAVVERPGGGHREADRQQRLHRRAGQAGPWRGPDRDVMKQHLMPEHHVFRPTERMERRPFQRPPLELITSSER